MNSSNMKSVHGIEALFTYHIKRRVTTFLLEGEVGLKLTYLVRVV